jgi:hypothetical protein
VKTQRTDETKEAVLNRLFRVTAAGANESWKNMFSAAGLASSNRRCGTGGSRESDREMICLNM